MGTQVGVADDRQIHGVCEGKHGKMHAKLSNNQQKVSEVDVAAPWQEDYDQEEVEEVQEHCAHDVPPG